MDSIMSQVFKIQIVLIKEIRDGRNWVEAYAWYKNAQPIWFVLQAINSGNAIFL